VVISALKGNRMGLGHEGGRLVLCIHGQMSATSVLAAGWGGGKRECQIGFGFRIQILEFEGNAKIED
jgi:hypothetical protein